MLHKALIFALFINITCAHAQSVGITPIKTTEKAADAKIDYQKTGAPMPPFLLVEPIDSSLKRVTKSKEKENVNASHREFKKMIKHGGQVKTEGYNYLTNEDLDNGAN